MSRLKARSELPWMQHIGGHDMVIVGRRRAPASTCTWWQSLTPAPLIVYDATCATDMATSLTNWASPGTLDLPASQPAPPTWTATGWTTNGTSTYLLTAWAGTGQPAMLVSYRQAVWSSGRYLFGARDATDASRMQLGYFDNWRQYHYAATRSTNAVVWPASGVLGIGSTGAWLDGSRVYQWTAATRAGAPPPMIIGAVNVAGTPSALLSARICQVVIWATTPSDAEMAAASAAMAARCPP